MPNGLSTININYYSTSVLSMAYKSSLQNN